MKSEYPHAYTPYRSCSPNNVTDMVERGFPFSNEVQEQARSGDSGHSTVLLLLSGRVCERAGGLTCCVVCGRPQAPERGAVGERGQVREMRGR